MAPHGSITEHPFCVNRPQHSDRINELSVSTREGSCADILAALFSSVSIRNVLQCAWVSSEHHLRSAVSMAY